MIIKYSDFIFENLNKSRSIVKSKMDDYEKIKTLLTSKKALGYMGKFTEFLFNGVPYSEIETLYNNITDLKKRNLKIDIDSFNKYEDVLDEIAKKEITYKFRAIFNQFPKEQKELFDDPKDMSRDDIITISKLHDVENYKPFISKISRYKSEWELMKALKRFLDGKIKSLTKEDIESMLDDDLQLVFENENIIILRTRTHESIIKVGSDTSWCIVSSSSTFKRYIEKGQTQYVIIDYTKDKYDTDHKIGFTLSKTNVILYAHDILDKSIIPYTIDLLNENNVNLDKINAPVKVDLTTFNKLTKLSEIETTLENFGYNNIELNKTLISILSYKLSRSKNGYDVKRVLENILRHIYDSKGEMLTMDEFNIYKDSLDQMYSEFESYMIRNGYLLSNKTPDYIWRSADVLKANYKNWKYKLSGNDSEYIEIVQRDHDFAEPMRYYALQNAKKYQLVIDYCDMILGKSITIEDIKSKIDGMFDKKDKIVLRYKYYNYFGIKYHFNPDLTEFMQSDFILPSDVTLKDTFWIRNFELVKNCRVTAEYTESYINEEVNKGFKLLNYGKNNAIKIARKSDNVEHHDWRDYNRISNIILEGLIGKGLFESQARKIILNSSLLPQSYDMSINISSRNNKLDMIIKVVINK